MQEKRTDSRRLLSHFPTFSLWPLAAASRHLGSRLRQPGGGALGLALVVLTTACNQPPGVNPWRDDSIPPMTWTTPSEQGILAAGHEPVVRQRTPQCTEARVVSGDVPHWPLWWEDPFEDQGDQDGQFAWTWQDYFAMPYSYARWHLNTLAFPISAIVTPPCTPMVSDGFVEPGHPHDARRGVSPDPSASSADFGYQGETPHSADVGETPTTLPSS